MRSGGILLLFFTLLSSVCAPLDSSCKEKKESKKREAPAPVVYRDYRVEGGMMRKPPAPDTLAVAGDSLAARPDSLSGGVRQLADTLMVDTLAPVLSPRRERRLERARQDADSTFVRYSPIFRDTMPLSRMAMISMAVPGFSQLHNMQYWKIPLAWISLGGMVAGYSYQNRRYAPWRDRYDYLVATNAPREEIDPVQARMITANTRRQLFMAGIYAAWVWFIADGAINYPGATTSVKKATTLSTILPGAGQIYNRSYWKVPFVLGGFATMGMVIDWNNRGYRRFTLAHKLLTDGDENTVDEFGGRYDATFLSNLRKSYRRNRDMAIILTGGLYLLNIIDAHVDSHLKTYDITDDLAWNIEPAITNFYSMRSSNLNMPGFRLSISF